MLYLFWSQYCGRIPHLGAVEGRKGQRYSCARVLFSTAELPVSVISREQSLQIVLALKSEVGATSLVPRPSVVIAGLGAFLGAKHA